MEDSQNPSAANDASSNTGAFNDEFGGAFSGRTDLSALERSVEQIRAEIGKIIVGQFDMLDLLIAAMLADGHVLIEGVPGVAKTLTAKLLSRTLDISFQRIQFTPDLMPSDVMGSSIYNQKTTDFEFKPGPIFSNLVLIDEINRSPAKTQAALFEAMEERQVTVDGSTYLLEPPFMVVATQNPIEQEGTYRLPEAQLDRFLFKISVDYPTLDQEMQIIQGANNRNNRLDYSAINTVMTGEELNSYRETVREVRIESSLIEYIANLVHTTRSDMALYLGASPRASLAIMMGAKAMAAMNGRDFVTPDDIKRVAAPVLGHRIILTPEMEMQGQRPGDVVERLTENIEVPR